MPPILVPFYAKRITIQILVILVIAKLNGRKDIVLRERVYDMRLPSKQYLFKVSN